MNYGKNPASRIIYRDGELHSNKFKVLTNQKNIDTYKMERRCRTTKLDFFKYLKKKRLFSFTIKQQTINKLQSFKYIKIRQGH